MDDENVSDVAMEADPSTSYDAQNQAMARFVKKRDGIVHEMLYKNRGLTPEVFRRRRELESVEIRKQKRDMDWSKKRLENAVLKDDKILGVENSDQSGLPVNRIAEDLFGGSTEMQERILRILKERLLKDESQKAADEIAEPSLIEQLVALLRRGSTSTIRRNALLILGLLCTFGKAERIVHFGAIPLFLRNTRFDDVEVRRCAWYALGNLASLEKFRTHCYLANITLELYRAFYNWSGEVNYAMRAAAELFKGKMDVEVFKEVKRLLPAFAVGLSSGDDERAYFASRCYEMLLSNCTDEQLSLIVTSDVVGIFVRQLSHHNIDIILSSLTVLGSILCGGDAITQLVLNCPNVLSELRSLLHHNNPDLLKETCWTISNITAGTRCQIQAVIDADIIPVVITVLSKSLYRVRKEACWILCNALLGGNDQQVHQIVKNGVIVELCDFLTVMDSSIVIAVLTAIDAIFQAGERLRCTTNSEMNPYRELVERAHGIEKIEFLSMSPNPRVMTEATKILKKYIPYGCNEDEESDCAFPVDFTTSLIEY